MSTVLTSSAATTTPYDAYLEWAATEAKRIESAFEPLFYKYRTKTGEDIVNDAIIDLMIREYVQGRRDGIDPA